MITVTNRNDKPAFSDQSEDLDRQTLALVQAAMKAGVTEFTTPGEGENRTNWLTRKWITLKSGKPVCFLVAFMEENAHFEIVGPEVPLPSSTDSGKK